MSLDKLLWADTESNTRALACGKTMSYWHITEVETEQRSDWRQNLKSALLSVVFFFISDVSARLTLCLDSHHPLCDTNRPHVSSLKTAHKYLRLGLNKLHSRVHVWMLSQRAVGSWACESLSITTAENQCADGSTVTDLTPESILAETLTHNNTKNNMKPLLYCTLVCRYRGHEQPGLRFDPD